MEMILDEFAQGNGLRDLDARIKILIGAGTILIGLASTSPAAPIFIAISLSLLTLFFARAPLRLYLSLLMIPLAFTLMGGLVIFCMSGGGAPLFSVSIFSWTITPTEGSLALAVMVMSRMLGGMCSLFFIALTTPITDIFSVLCACRFPRSLIDLSMLIYHFIFVLIGEAISIHTAQELRHGYSSFRNSVNSFAMLGAMLFIRAWKQGEELLVAMDARCYDGKLELSPERGGLQARTVAPAAAYLIACTGIAVMTSSVHLPGV
jgi:cobalt/nickel transport system permease protein